MKANTQKTYANRIERVLNYIEDRLDQTMTVEELSQLAFLSPFHFHRIFTTFVGMSLGKYIQFLKLKRAAYQLAWTPSIPIIDIAFNAGFSSHEAFSRAFKKLTSLSPSQFRKKPYWAPLRFSLPEFDDEPITELDIKQMNNIPVACVQHRGDIENIYYSFDKINLWANSNNAPIKAGKLYGICYEDPQTVAPADFRFDIAIAKDSSQLDYSELIEQEIPSGRYACFSHQGSHQHFGRVIRNILTYWFPRNNEELSDENIFFHYKSLVTETATNDLITDIYFPLKDKQ